MLSGHWVRVTKFDPRAVAVYLRHYSARVYRDGRPRRQFMPPGETLVLLTPACDALFAWYRATVDRADHQEGVACTVFRNESPVLSSVLIAEACERAWDRWPGRRLFTYVADAKVRSVNPGCCFKEAGWRSCGRNKDGRLSVLERFPEAVS